MGGIFGAVSRTDCVRDLFFGTDYHSHLGTSRGGMAVWNGTEFNHSIHNIENTPFRTVFEADLAGMSGMMGVGCISDNDAQPLILRSHLGNFAITTVAKINNMPELVAECLSDGNTHFLEMTNGRINPTELAATIINRESNFEDGIRSLQEKVDGSCTFMILTPEGIYAARDKYGRTPLLVGERGEGDYCVSFESCAMPNLGYRVKRELGPGEVLFISTEGIRSVSPPRDEMSVCAFLWVYYGYPSSTYEGMNVEMMRYRSGAALAKNDDVEIDLVAGVPDSGVAHAIGYANESGIPFSRPFVKYTPTWPRSFMPQDQNVRNLVARMKLIPVYELINGKKMLFCEDSIVRGTQLRETVNLLYECGAKEVHLRPACPPLTFGCKFLNFSTSRSEMDLAARQAIREIEGDVPVTKEMMDEYCDASTEKYAEMVRHIAKKLNLTSLKYQKLEDMLDAIGLPHEKVCTYCWNGKDCRKK
jgi:amidophosphoribosyltransferase